jgi:tRNA(adenine34) deaminase
MNSTEAMKVAIELAKNSHVNDVPVGAVILNSSGDIVATGTNERELHKDPSAHAEVVAIRKAAQEIGDWRLDSHTLVVTLEPCAMCAGAIAQARIPHLVFGAWDKKAGAVGSVWDVLRDPRALHKMDVTSGVLEVECAQLLTSFFRKEREAK